MKLESLMDAALLVYHLKEKNVRSSTIQAPPPHPTTARRPSSVEFGTIVLSNAAA